MYAYALMYICMYVHDGLRLFLGGLGLFSIMCLGLMKMLHGRVISIFSLTSGNSLLYELKILLDLCL